jgi:hypothetical protein
MELIIVDKEKMKDNQKEIEILREINKSIHFKEFNFNKLNKSNGLIKYEGNIFLHLYFRCGVLHFLNGLDKKFNFLTNIDVIPTHNIKEATTTIRSVIREIKIKNIFNGDIVHFNDLEILERSQAGLETLELINYLFNCIEIKQGNAMNEDINKIDAIKEHLLNDKIKTIKDLVILMFGYEFVNKYRFKGRSNELAIKLNSLDYILIDRKNGEFYYFENEQKMKNYLTANVLK